MRYHVRTLLITVTLGPPVLAAIWFLSHSIIGALVWGVFLGSFALLSWQIVHSRFNAWVRGTLLVIVFLLAPTIYVLSSGPVVWLVNHGYTDRFQVHIPYAPVHWGIVKSDFFRRFMWWYLEFWDESMPFQSASPFDPPVRWEDYPELRPNRYPNGRDI